MIKQVLVGSKRYDIQQKSIVILDGEQVGASFDGPTSVITIAETLGDGAKPHALLHEIVHSILFDGGYYEENEKEKLVNDLAQQIILLIRQNPHLVRYIQKTAEINQAVSESQGMSVGSKLFQGNSVPLMSDGDDEDD